MSKLVRVSEDRSLDRVALFWVVAFPAFGSAAAVSLFGWWMLITGTSTPSQLLAPGIALAGLSVIAFGLTAIWFPSVALFAAVAEEQ